MPHWFDVAFVGACCFGLVVGWIVHAAYSSQEKVTITWVSAVIGVIGGGAVTAIFQDRNLFAGYCIGLAGSFFFRLMQVLISEGRY